MSGIHSAEYPSSSSSAAASRFSPASPYRSSPLQIPVPARRMALVTAPRRICNRSRSRAPVGLRHESCSASTRRSVERSVVAASKRCVLAFEPVDEPQHRKVTGQELWSAFIPAPPLEDELAGIRFVLDEREPRRTSLRQERRLHGDRRGWASSLEPILVSTGPLHDALPSPARRQGVRGPRQPLRWNVILNRGRPPEEEGAS